MKFSKEQMIALLLQLGSFLLSKLGLGGFWGFVAKHALKYIVKALVKLGVKWNENIKQHRELKRYQEALSKNLTPEQREQAEADFLTDDDNP